ncbi:GroES-like protein [Cryphonectria parasitica EP155]|uniref:GroES-like protein n=1 Tax=Cryphonectria parasitica (strain ATCC 38755 / EP155) TaxID=660469 RepID=A0A9P4YAG5_CRYP1|nr:GroES-like protein [Cryphonectria parasitica EP155]KAF3769435.1 GroES-like protein [Cryphonectria parasitica EP155]
MPSAIPVVPTSQTAIVAEGAGKISIRHDAPVAALSPGTAMVRTAAVAINPVDAKMLDYSPVPGAIHGYDFAGTIVALGPDTPAHLQIGDRVAGFVHGMNPSLPDVGAFAQYVAAPAELLLKLPVDMSFTDAASIGLGLFTAGLGLFRELEIPASLDPEKPGPTGPHGAEFVLVAGGATATGTRAIQLLKLAGLRPIATCSAKNFQLVRSFGAEEVFEYSDPECAAAIRKYTGNTLAYALDCVATAETTQLCYGAIGRAGGRYATVEPFRDAIAAQRPHTIKPSWLLALTVFGRKVALDGDYARDPSPEDHRLAVELTKQVQVWLDRGQISVHPVKIMTGGWDAVLEGVDIIRKQAVSGQKLVYPV